MSASSPLAYEFCALTDQGRVRSNNEDAVTVDVAGQVAVLADGMGGYNAGEVASRMATELIRQGLAEWLAGAGRDASLADLRQAMEACVDSANRAIYDASHSNAQYAGMGTTVVVAAFREDGSCSGTSAIRAATACATATCSRSRGTIPGCRNRSTPGC